GDQVLDLARRHEVPIRGHVERRGLHPRAVVFVFAPALRRAVEDVLADVLGRLHVHHLRLLGERGHLAFLAARVLGAAAAVGAVTREAAELRGEPMTAPGGCLLDRQHDPSDGRIEEPARLDRRRYEEEPYEAPAHPTGMPDPGAETQSAGGLTAKPPPR